MEAGFSGERNSEFRNTSMEAIITAIELWISIKAVIENGRERLRKWVANGNAATTKGHGVTEIGVGRMALRWATNVDHLRRIILVKKSYQIISIEDGVIVTKHIPASIGQTQPKTLSDYAGDAEPRWVTRRIRVAEPGYVL